MSYTPRMPLPRDPHEENLRALEELEQAARDKLKAAPGTNPAAARKPAAPQQAAAAGDDAFPPIPATPPPPQSTDYGPTRPARRDPPPTAGPQRVRPPQGQARSAVPKRAPAAVEIGDEPDFHCLNCGYGLFCAVSMRCSECGEQYDEETLRRWFDGTEQERLRQLTWFIHPILVLKIWMLPSIFGLLDFGCFNWLVFATSAAMSIWALTVVVRDRRETIGGYYGIAGMFAALVLCALSLFGGIDYGSQFASPGLLFGLDAVCASLLLLSLLHPADDSKLWRRRTMSVIALVIAVSAPPVGALLNRLEQSIRSGLAGPGAPPSAEWPVFTTALMALVSIGAWIVVRQWIVGFRGLMYAPAHVKNE